MVQKLPDDVTYDDLIDRLDTLKDIEIGIEQIERGEYITHEELEKKLREEGWLDEPESSGPKKRTSSRACPPRHQPPRLPAGGAGVHQPDRNRNEKPERLPRNRQSSRGC
jgi:hypothetical protein